MTATTSDARNQATATLIAQYVQAYLSNPNCNLDTATGSLVAQCTVLARQTIAAYVEVCEHNAPATN